MNADQARKLASEALTQLSQTLAAGKSEALTAYLAMMAQFHRYSWSNSLLILCQKPTATQVAGFHAWRKLGRFVRKGEHGIAIVAPMVIKSRDQSTEDAAAEDKALIRFKTVHVFDVSQTDGEALPAIARIGGDPGEATCRLKALIASKGIVLEYADDLGGPDGLSCNGRIRIRSGMSPAEEFSVLTHELAHELLHKGVRRTQIGRTVRETEAEAVAFVVSAAIGLETGTAASDYIHLYDGSQETLAESLDFIQKTAAEIIAAISDESPEPTDPSDDSIGKPQYDAGHPWRYLPEGDAQPPMPVDRIPAAEAGSLATDDLPKDYVKRESKLRQLLDVELASLEERKRRYQEVVDRGAESLSRYDREIAYGGDDALARASTLALLVSQISFLFGRINWLRSELDAYSPLLF